MGLDIILYRALKYGEEKNAERLTLQTDCNSLEIEKLKKSGFEKYFNYIENTYYETLILPIEKTPIFKRMDVEIPVEMIGYQRKGMNDDFYEKWCEDDKCAIITSRDEVEQVCESSYDIDYSKKEFLNNFKEGETFLVLDY